MSIASPAVRQRDGFTIVELLIVIVVIGILAAITIVAYNGIQSRATFTRQVAEIDRVGKAIQLWTAANGKSIGQSGHGYNGNGYGGFNVGVGAYPPPSLEDMLRQEGFLTGTITVNANYMLASCTDDLTNPRWAVLADLTPAPGTTMAQQTAGTGCSSWTLNLYTDPAGSYHRNFAKVF